jgi:superfamily I DNA/RNA helicase/Zn-dependent peptidase ImmA (M78 family)
MNPFQRAREEALRIRTLLAPGHCSELLKSRALLEQITPVIGIVIRSVNPAYPDLGGGSALLHRIHSFIYVSNDIEEWSEHYCALVAHELGHWFLDAAPAPKTIATLTTALGSGVSQAIRTIEAYGARERQELQANVFARELLLPRPLARTIFESRQTTQVIGDDIGIPEDFVRQQMLDAVLLPEGQPKAVQLQPPSADQECAAQAQERFACVIAGPGTGKTSTLIHRVKHLLAQGADPSQILVLTFTNKAAFELVERLRAAGIDGASKIWAGTFHAFGLEFFRKFHERFHLDADIRVADKLSVLSLLAADIPHMDLKFYSRLQDPYDWLGPVFEAITRLKESLVSPAEYRQRIQKLSAKTDDVRSRREDVATIFERYDTCLEIAKSVDFVDLIAKPALAIREDRAAYSLLADKFQHILVDEYQDVTKAMVELLRQTARNAKSLWVVGDIRQAIHHWRGASLHSLLKFDSEFQAHAGSSKIGRYPLDVNRRSYDEVLKLVEEIGRRHSLEPKMPLTTMTALKGPCGTRPTLSVCANAEAMHASIARGIRELKTHGVSYGTQAVLSRKNDDVQAAATYLSTHGIPVIYVGALSFRPEIKTLLCLMQLLVNRHPSALIGLMGDDTLAMPWADIQRLVEATRTDVRLQRGRWLKTPPPGLSDAAMVVIEQLRLLLGGKTRYSNPWAVVCDLVLNHGIGLPAREDKSVTAWVQRIALWQFAYQVRSGDDPRVARLSRFFARQRLRERIGENYADRELPPETATLDGVRVATLHASKGLEFNAIHLSHINADSFGSERASWRFPPYWLELVPPPVMGSSDEDYAFETAVERNNLLYVGTSRARRYLRLYYDAEFGLKNLPTQLEGCPHPYDRVTVAAIPTAATATTRTKAFDPPAQLGFDSFSSYACCPLQYFYTHVLEVNPEDQLDPSLRARGVIMRALKAVAFNTASATTALAAEWEAKRLPSATLDPSLWHAANAAYQRGLALIERERRLGAQVGEPMATIHGLNVTLPWGFKTAKNGSTRFSILCLMRRAGSEMRTLLSPMIAGLNFPGAASLDVRYVLAEEIDTVAPSRRIEATKAFKSAVRLQAGINEPAVGWHCGRCSYLTICPNAPVV